MRAGSGVLGPTWGKGGQSSLRHLAEGDGEEVGKEGKERREKRKQEYIQNLQRRWHLTCVRLSSPSFLLIDG